MAKRSTPNAKNRADNVVFEELIFSRLNIRPVFPNAVLLQQTLDHLYAVKDERALVLVGALLVENAIDDLLLAFMPGYKKLSDNREFTFSMKTELAKTLGLCPPELFVSVDIVRKIRNDFAHQLTIDTFSKIPEIVKRLRQHFTSMRTHFGQYQIDTSDDAQVFKLLIYSVVEMLYYYRLQIWLLS